MCMRIRRRRGSIGRLQRDGPAVAWPGTSHLCSYPLDNHPESQGTFYPPLSTIIIITRSAWQTTKSSCPQQLKKTRTSRFCPSFSPTAVWRRARRRVRVVATHWTSSLLTGRTRRPASCGWRRWRSAPPTSRCPPARGRCTRRWRSAGRSSGCSSWRRTGDTLKQRLAVSGLARRG